MTILGTDLTRCRSDLNCDLPYYLTKKRLHCFPSTCTLQQQRFPKETHHMLIMRHVFNLTTSNYLFKQGFI
jgi:hypothetical protein